MFYNAAGMRSSKLKQCKGWIGELVAVQGGLTLVTGPSSMIFWCRRCTEQSLEYREQQLPCSSHSSWTSRWREAAASFMAKIGDPGTSPCTYKRSMHSVRNGFCAARTGPAIIQLWQGMSTRVPGS